jgi:acetone carboxylase gamma subunit
MAANAVIYELGAGDLPWRYALRLVSVDADTFTQFLAQLKASVPSRQRKWDPAAKRWLFRDVDTIEYVMHLLRQYGLTYEHDAGGDGHAAALPVRDAYAVLWLREGAPAELVTAAYKTLAKLYHPDAGGDTAYMQRINAAAELLRR